MRALGSPLQWRGPRNRHIYTRSQSQNRPSTVSGLILCHRPSCRFSAPSFSCLLPSQTSALPARLSRLTPLSCLGSLSSYSGASLIPPAPVGQIPDPSAWNRRDGWLCSTRTPWETTLILSAKTYPSMEVYRSTRGWTPTFKRHSRTWRQPYLPRGISGWGLCAGGSGSPSGQGIEQNRQCIWRHRGSY